MTDFLNGSTSAPEYVRKPPNCHTTLEVFLSQIESDLLNAIKKTPYFLKKEFIRSVADYNIIVTERAEKRTWVVVWDRKNHFN